MSTLTLNARVPDYIVLSGLLGSSVSRITGRPLYSYPHLSTHARMRHCPLCLPGERLTDLLCCSIKAHKSLNDA